MHLQNTENVTKFFDRYASLRRISSACSLTGDHNYTVRKCMSQCRSMRPDREVVRNIGNRELLAPRTPSLRSGKRGGLWGKYKTDKRTSSVPSFTSLAHSPHCLGLSCQELKGFPSTFTSNIVTCPRADARKSSKQFCCIVDVQWCLWRSCRDVTPSPN